MSKSMTIRFPGGKRVAAQYGDFEIATDQPEKAGGEASAPAPFDLFLASIGTCAGFFVLSFCQQRNIPEQGIELVQTWERDTETKVVKTIRIAIHVPPEFPEKYYKALVRAVDQCAVKKTIQSMPEFLVETVRQEQ